MLHGDLITITAKGPVVRPKLLQPIGILSGSQCWGIRVPDVHYVGEPKRPDHLLISPINPDSWASIFRMTIMLRDVGGALKEAVRILVEKNINIIFAECTPAGHNHAAWNIIGEVLDIKEAAERLRATLSLGTGDTVKGRDDERLTLRRHIRVAKLAVLEDLVRSLCSEDDKFAGDSEPILRERRFLHDRWRHRRVAEDGTVASIGRGPLKTEEIQSAFKALFPEGEHSVPSTMTTDEYINLEAVHASHLHLAVEYHLMHNLLYFWSTTSRPPHVLPLRYDDHAMLLEAVDPDDYVGELTSHMEVSADDLPTRALASFDTSEHYFRCRLLPREHVEQKLISVDVEYHRLYEEDAPALQRCSRGLLLSVTEHLPRGVNLLRVSNRIGKSARHSEHGNILLLGEAEKEALAALDDALAQIDYPGRSDPRNNSTVTWARHRFECIFLSMKEDWSQADDALNYVESAARQLGVTVEYCNEPGDRATEEVRKKIRESQGFLQIVACNRRKKRASAAWLNAEYGIAYGNGLHIIRLVDIDLPAHLRGEFLKFDRELTALEFRSSDPAEKNETQFRKAVEILVRKFRASKLHE